MVDKRVLREETERLVREALERKSVTVKTANTRFEAKCGKCGAANKVTAPKGSTRVKFNCKECGQAQAML